jgi:hypothetical protein
MSAARCKPRSTGPAGGFGAFLDNLDGRLGVNMAANVGRTARSAAW